jgi:RND family efflux transporter MFP subunit
MQKLFGAALLLPLVMTSACKKDDATATAPPPLPVKLQTVQSGQVEDSSEFVGNLEAKQKVALAPQIAGRIEQILVAQGETVAQGTPVLQLRPEKQEAQVAGSVATVSAATATLQNAQAEARAADSEVARLEAQIKAQEADVQSKTAALDLARTNYERSQSLVAEGAAAQQDLDDKTNALRNATAARDAALQTLEANRRAYNTAIARAQGSKASIDAANANLQNAQAQARSAGVDLGYNQVVAPLDGIVGDLLFKVGDFVNVGQQVTSIIQNDELDLRISVPTERTGQLRLGLPVVLLDPNTKQSLASGSINFISPQVDSAAQAILTKARFPNRTGKLRDGQYVQAKVVWNRSTGVTVPTTAISRIGGQSFVFVASEGPCDPSKAEIESNAAPPTETKLVVCQKPVQLGDVQGSNYKVLQGLKPGDRVAVSNILKLRDGAPIQPEA